MITIIKPNLMVVMTQTKAPFPQSSPQVNFSVFLWPWTNNSNKFGKIFQYFPFYVYAVISAKM